MNVKINDTSAWNPKAKDVKTEYLGENVKDAATRLIEILRLKNIL